MYMYVYVYICICILYQILFQRLLLTIECSSLCYMLIVGPCCLSTLYIVACIC